MIASLEGHKQRFIHVYPFPLFVSSKTRYHAKF